MRVIASIMVASILLAGGRASGATDDAGLAKQFVGKWIPDPEHLSDSEKALRQRGIYGYEEFNDDGTGGAYLFQGKMCGPPLISAPFQWKIEGGILIENGLLMGKPRVDHDKVLSVTDDHYVTQSQDAETGGRMEYRVKATPCPAV